jgi:hypothetical protein
MALAWGVFPLLLLAICLGCGLLVEWIAGWRVPGALLPSLGLALVIVVASLTTRRADTAPLTTACVVVLTVAGYALGRRRALGLRPKGWPLALGLASYVVFAAPVVLSGSAAFLGYFTLNDASVHFSLIDQLLSHGRDLSNLTPPSSYSSVVQNYISTDYPIGSQVALGAVRPLIGQDIAWIFAPYMAVIMSLGAVTLYVLLDGVVSSRPLRALTAFIAGQAGLLYAYYLEGSIKELASAWVITLVVTLVVLTLAGRFGLRRLVPLVIVTVAGLDVLNLAIAPWLALPLACFVVAIAWRYRHAARRAPTRRVAIATAIFLVAVAAIAAPVVRGVSSFVNTAEAVLTQAGDLGNLYSPLPKWEMFGIWPSGDFRIGVTDHYRITYALIGIAIASAVFGVIWLWRRRSWGPLLLIVSDAIAAGFLLTRASPYASAKVMAIFSLATVLAAMLGAAALNDYGRRLECWGLAALIAGGVLWTNARGYHYAAVAPRGRFEELAQIGHRFAGQGPAFYNLSDEYAIHFLRSEAPDDFAISGPPPQRTGLPPRTPAQVREPWDPDEVDPSYLQAFPLLVLGRSPLVSRPPADYQLAYRGRYYEVWRRTPTPTVLEHVPLGSALDAGSVPSCGVVGKLARKAAREHARLAYVPRTPLPVMIPTEAERPPNWGEVDGAPYTLIPREQAGSVIGPMVVSHPGRYQVWLEGSFSQRMQVYVGGQHVGSVSDDLGPPGQFRQIGYVNLKPGKTQAVIVRPEGNLLPGQEGTSWLLGPLLLATEGSPTHVSEVDPAHARSLCGQTLDWIEIVR